MSQTEEAVRATAVQQRLDERRWYALALLCTTLFVIILDASVVIVAIPSIERDLAMAVGVSQWVISGYAVLFGGLLLLGGRVADRPGRRPLRRTHPARAKPGGPAQPRGSRGHGRRPTGRTRPTRGT